MNYVTIARAVICMLVLYGCADDEQPSGRFNYSATGGAQFDSPEVRSSRTRTLSRTEDDSNSEHRPSIDDLRSRSEPKHAERILGPSGPIIHLGGGNYATPHGPMINMGGGNYATPSGPIINMGGGNFATPNGPVINMGGGNYATPGGPVINMGGGVYATPSGPAIVTE